MGNSVSAYSCNVGLRKILPLEEKGKIMCLGKGVAGAVTEIQSSGMPPLAEADESLARQGGLVCGKRDNLDPCSFDQLIKAGPGVWRRATPGQHHAGFQKTDAGEQAAVGGDDPGEEIVSIRLAAQDGDQHRRIEDDHAGRPLLS